MALQEAGPGRHTAHGLLVAASAATLLVGRRERCVVEVAVRTVLSPLMHFVPAPTVICAVCTAPMVVLCGYQDTTYFPTHTHGTCSRTQPLFD